jgi:F-type H+-transporting ATPase subunit a
VADPLHQFVIKPVIDLPEVAGLNLDFTNSSLWMVIAIAVSVIFMTISMRHKSLIPGRMQVFAELMYKFIAGILQDNAGPEGRRYMPFVFTVFIVVLMGNVLGLIPGSFTYTGHLIVTLTLALIVFLTVVVLGFVFHGLRFLQLFFLPGVPVLILPILTPIEIISYLARPVTLSLRLFINMFAGHLMLKVVAGFSVSLFALGFFGVLGSIGTMLFNSIMVGFELFVALIQAYVFVMLTSSYLKDTIEIAH